MAIRLYKAGDTHIVRGIPCEMHDCNEYSYEHLLKTGWYLRPENIPYPETDESEDCKQEKHENKVRTVQKGRRGRPRKKV